MKKWGLVAGDSKRRRLGPSESAFLAAVGHTQSQQREQQHSRQFFSCESVHGPVSSIRQDSKLRNREAAIITLKTT